MDFQRRHQTLYEEALALKKQGRLPEAQEREAEAAALLEELRRYTQQYPDSLQTATYLLFLAERHWALAGDHPDVQSEFERALALSESHAGPDGLPAANALEKLAEFHFLAGRWSVAEPMYRRAISILDRPGAVRGPSYAKCQAGLAQTLAALGRTQEADLFFARAAELMEGPEGDKRVLYFLYTYRAEGLEKLGRHAEAKALTLKANGLLPRNNPGELGFHV